jgi:short-subunit dehydrogenase
VAGSVVVLTGASSGVGRATALAFAEAGARLVLAARTASALDTLVEECRARGADAIAVPTDVGDPRQVRRLADAAVEAYGRIDTWVNDAAVLVAGVFGDEDVEEIERLVRTNVAGAAYGSRAALAQFRRQGEGVLIDVSSLLGLVPNPLVPTYVMSKFAVRGLSLSLHHLTSAWPGIRVCVVLPGPIDTPLFERAANHTGRRLRAIPPAMAPERVAAKIVACARRPRRQATIGASGHAILVGHRLAPRLTEWAIARAAAALLVRGEEADDTSGELFAGRAAGHRHGGWRRGRLRRKAGEALGRAAS